jgi:hypothetical protein
MSMLCTPFVYSFVVGEFGEEELSIGVLLYRVLLDRRECDVIRSVVGEWEDILGGAKEVESESKEWE